jgi:CubicO group peptidase (beta-lactamase class C family)
MLAGESAVAARDNAPSGAVAGRAADPLPMGDAADAGLSAERLRRIDAILERHVAAGNITGGVAAFARRGKLVYWKAFGQADREAGVAMPRDAIFQMYSSTKVVTSVALLMLMEEGRLRLEDPVSRYLPDFKDARVAVHKPGEAQRFVPRAAGTPPPPFDTVPAVRDLTIRDLMTHTGGLVSSDPRRVGMDAPVRAKGESLESHVAKLAKLPLDYQPGTRWSYSPLAGCDVLARVVEVVSGMPFDRFLHDRIFAPLGMNDTYFDLPPEKRSRLLPVYWKRSGGWVRLPPEATAAGTGGDANVSGSMGLVSTARDFLLLHQMLLNKGELNGHRLLGTRTVEQMATNHVGDLYRGEGAYAVPMHGHGFGLLVQVVLDPVEGNTGRSAGAYGFGGYLGTMDWTDPKEEIAGVLMLQQNNREVHIDFERAIRQAIVE